MPARAFFLFFGSGVTPDRARGKNGTSALRQGGRADAGKRHLQVRHIMRFSRWWTDEPEKFDASILLRRTDLLHKPVLRPPYCVNKHTRMDRKMDNSAQVKDLLKSKHDSKRPRR